MNAAEWLSYHVAIPATFAAAVLFIVTYTFLAPWWRNQIGITLVALDAIIAVVTLPGTLSLLFHVTAGAWYTWFALGAFTLTPAVIGWRTWILVVVNHRKFVWPWQHRGRPAGGGTR